MKVLLFEQWSGGHYSNYMNCLVPEIARLSTKLIIAGDASVHGSPSALAWAAHANVEFAPVLPAVSIAHRAIDRYAAARNLITCLRTVRPDFTLLPSADAQSTMLAALQVLNFNIAKCFGPIEGTFHAGYGYSASSERDRLKEFVYSQTYRRLRFASVNFVNFSYYEYVVAKRLIEPGRIYLVGDPVPQAPRVGQHTARMRLGLDPDGRYLGLLGGVDRRKAIPQLLAAFRAANLGRTVRLLLAGRLEASFAALIAAQYQDLVREGRIVVLDRFLTDDELNFGYEALDVATAVYYRFPGLSSLALKAVAAGTPLVAHDFGWLRAVIRRFELGECTNIFDQAEFAKALRSALDRGRNSGQVEAVRRLLAFHTEKNFVAKMTRGLRHATGAPDEVALDWDWVMEAIPPERRHFH